MIQDKIFFDEKDPTGLNYNTPFTVFGSYEGRLWSKAPGGEIKYYTQNSDLSVFATTGSNQFEGNQAITGSLVVTGGITGTATTASHVTYANVANKPTLVSGSSQVSFTGITNKPTLVSGSSQVSYSGITNKPTLVSSSVQVLNYGVFATTGSNGFNGSQSITGSLTVTGQVIAQTINVQQVTSSIVYSSGSNIFGNNSGNTHQFTGSLNVNGQGTFYQPLNNSTAYLTVQNNRARNAAVYTQTTSGGFYAGTSIGTDTFNYQIYDGVAGSARLTIASTGAATFSSGIATLGYTASTSYAALFNGSVGIGLTGPRSILEIQKTSGNTSIGVASNASLTLSQGGAINELSQINFGYTATNSPAVIGYITTSATDNTKGSLIFATRDVTTDSVPTTRLTIASTGAATFSTSAAVGGLNLTGNYTSKLGLYNGGGSANMELGNAINTNGSILSRLVSTNANNGNIGNESVANFIGVASIETQLVSTSNNASGQSGANMLFFTKADGGLLTERMRITSGGDVNIGGFGTIFPVLTVKGIASSPHIGSTWSVSANQDGTGRTIIGTAGQGRSMYFENNGDIVIPNNTLLVSNSIRAGSFSTSTKTSIGQNSGTVPANTATAIFTKLGGSNGGAFVLVTGSTSAGNWFFDTIAYINDNTATTISSQGGGSPPARSYSVSGQSLILTVSTALNNFSAFGLSTIYN